MKEIYSRLRHFAPFLLLLGGCGGGGVEATPTGVDGYTPPGTGQVYIDAFPDTPAYDPLACGSIECRISTSNDNQLDNPPYNRYITFAGQSRPANGTPDPCGSGKGSLKGQVVDMDDCFRGRFVDPTTALSDDGKMRLFWSIGFSLGINASVWVDTDQPSVEYHFPSAVTDLGSLVTSETAIGCKVTGGAITPTSITATYPTDINSPNREYTATITTTAPAATWTGTIFGMKGLHLESVAGGRLYLTKTNRLPKCS